MNLLTKPSEQIMRQITAAMENFDIRNIDLAAEMHVSEARISQIFGEGSNITLATVDRIHAALHAILARRPPKPIVFFPHPGWRE